MTAAGVKETRCCFSGLGAGYIIYTLSKGFGGK